LLFAGYRAVCIHLSDGLKIMYFPTLFTGEVPSTREAQGAALVNFVDDIMRRLDHVRWRRGEGGRDVMLAG